MARRFPPAAEQGIQIPRERFDPLTFRLGSADLTARPLYQVKDPLISGRDPKYPVAHYHVM